jgi:hypothetical protein
MSKSIATSSLSTVYSKDALFEFASKNPDRTYISIHENVYDVTEFLDEVNLKNFSISFLQNILEKVFILINN